MKVPRLGVRQRVFLACLVMSLVAVAALSAGGLAFRRALRARARDSCTRIARLFEGIAHTRLITMVAEAKALGNQLGSILRKTTPGPHTPWPVARSGGVLCSWALYSPDGRRLAAECSEPEPGLLARAGIGSATVPQRERNRFEQALRGTASTVLVPAGEELFAIYYQRVGCEEPLGVLQVATEMTPSVFPAPQEAGGARAVLRPFIASADTPRLVRLGGEPRLLVHRPLMCGKRQLGTIVAAVPYGAEARYEQLTIFSVVVVLAGAMLILGFVSYTLTDVALVPLMRVREFVRDLQSGGQVERLEDIPDDEAGALLRAYQQALSQAQDWADRIVEVSRAQRELLSGAVEALVSAIEAKDVYTAGHSQRVADMACQVAIELGWDGQAIEELRLGAILHDIGKIGINLKILNKPDSLDPEETEVVRQHTLIGARILSSIPGCEEVVRTVLYHHERWDGRGYPTGLAGTAIPAAARIVGIADVYDALTSERSYRPAFPHEKAVEIMERNRGKMFDPDLLDVFLRVVGQRVVADAAGPAAPADPQRQPEPTREEANR